MHPRYQCMTVNRGKRLLRSAGGVPEAYTRGIRWCLLHISDGESREEAFTKCRSEGGLPDLRGSEGVATSALRRHFAAGAALRRQGASLRTFTLCRASSRGEGSIRIGKQGNRIIINLAGLLRHHEPAQTPIQRVQNSGFGILDQNSTKSRILDLERPTTIFWTLPSKY